MNWQDTPRQAALRAEVREFVATSFPADYRPDFTGEHSLEPEDVLGYNWAADVDDADLVRSKAARLWAERLAERGWIAPHWPECHGGAGLGPLEGFILHEEMMRAGVPTVNGIGAFLLGPTLLEFGTDEQKDRFLRGIASGQTRWAQGFSEPNAGSDLASLGTRAVRDGDHYVVNGQKTWMSLGHHADWLFALVRTDPHAAKKHRGITFLLIDARAPGVEIRPIRDLRGATPFSEVFFEDVRVPVSQRVGEENRGFYVAMATLTFERSGIGAVIKYEQILRDLFAWVRQARGDGRLRTDFDQAVLDELMQRWVEVRVLYQIALGTVARQHAGAEGYDASANQLFSAELHQRIARTGARVLGQGAQLWRREGAPMNALFAHLCGDAVAATFLAGTSEIQRSVIATRGLGLPRS